MIERFTWAGALRFAAVACLALLFGGCDGGSSGSGGGGGQTAGARLLKTEYGRLVDIFAFRRVDPSLEDRRLTANREAVLIAQDVVIDPEIETEELFDSVGEARPGASYRFLSFDVSTGHEELLILWDDRYEPDMFQSAYDSAVANLVEVSPAFRDQNIILNPIPIVPRNAAIKLTFSGPLGVDSGFFEVNPSAIQVLRFRDDPNVVPANRAFEPADVRILSDGGDTVVIDVSIIGGEANGRTSPGLEPSSDNLTANYRIAIPTEGVASRQLRIGSDPNPDLNGVDSRGDQSVIRDFRSGNPSDGRVGALTDFQAPNIISFRRMGIRELDRDERVATLAKRGADLAIRARLPFVDGVVDRDSARPKGPSAVPTIDQNNAAFPLPSGDFLVQTVLSPFTGEAVRIRAEVVQVLEVGTVEGDAAFAGPGLTASGTDGGELAEIHVRLSSISAFDSEGNEVFLDAEDNNGAGADCDVSVRYYEALRYASGSSVLTDANRRAEFIVVDPLPAGPLPNEGLAPTTTLAVRFSEPLDLASVSAVDNYVLTNPECDASNYQQVMAEAKSATLNVLVSRLIDQRGDATLLKLQPPNGLFHENGQSEEYWFHIDLVSSGVIDFAGNILDVFDRRPPGTITVGNLQIEVPLLNWSSSFTLDSTADDNWVGSRVFRFASADEDGTQPGSIDFFGQFRISDGMLAGAPVTRRSATADGQNLGSIQRWDKGECVAPENPVTGTPPTSTPPPGNAPYGPGVLYRTPSMVAVQPTPPLVFQPPMGPQTFGGIVEPHTARGARMQMSYREDDFSLSYHDANDHNIDVEQLHWAPWNESVVLFDRFDRYTMRLAHSKKRPDRLFTWFIDPQMMAPSACGFDCLSLYSGLYTRFDENVLRGPEFYGTVVRDAEYVINPNDAFRSNSGIKYVPYPKFEDTYTWRDHRLVSWDTRTDQAIGLGGAQDAQPDPPDGDRTASVSSPWIEDDPETAVGLQGYTGLENWLHEQLVRDQADFLGDRTLDHDPIALPLLVDIMVWPDDTRAVANAGNLFHIAYVGPIWSPIDPAGYYNAGSGVSTTAPPDPYTCTNIDWPFFRVYSFGGPDPNRTGAVTFLEPDKEHVARGGVIKDMGLGDPTYGLYQTKAGDGHVHWAQIDFVRRVSVLTFGFFDSLQPNRHDLGSLTPPLPGLPATEGRPNFEALANGELGLQTLSAVFDPPPAEQPGGTRISIEYRGANALTNADIYDRVADDAFDTRGNLLNPNYACEAYRYAMANPGPPGNTPRVVLDQGISPYVTEENLDSLRDPLTQELPRFVNFRLVLENNVDSDPTVVPTLRSLGLVFRVLPRN